jgi:DNA-binding beta-propeller fold protein YncE
MMSRYLFVTGASLAALSLSATAQAEPAFNRIASFPVIQTLPEGADATKPTSAEIITVTPDGMTLVFSDSPGKRIGLIDITDPRQPRASGSIALEGEPTSVSATGKMILVGLNTSKSKAEPSGALLAIDAASKMVSASCDLGGQPDSVAVSPDGTIAAVAVENERDEDLNDGAIPQMPAGNVQIFKLMDGVPDCADKVIAAVTGLAAVAGEDPEPEFVDINAANEIAVTLQENNHVVVLDAAGKVISHFSAGAVDLAGIDTKRDGALSFTGEKKEQLREPDTIQWVDGNRLVTGNEGDYEGGSRGFTIFSKTGEVLFESGASLEHQIALHGHYPDRRNSKGNEPEGAEVKAFADTNYIFVLSERASMVAVYKDTGAEPQFSQLLPSGLSPEGIIAFPERNLIAVANEVDLVEDGGVRSHVTLYELSEGAATYPSIVSVKDGNGVPIGWGALSGLAADPSAPGMLHAVNDSFYSGQPTIFSIDATKKPAVITAALPITRNGNPAQLLDIEGIAPDGKGGFWLASEGRGDQMIPHGILHVNEKGEIDQTIGLPDELLRGATRFGFEGITVTGTGDDAVLWMAVQREWADDEKGTVKLVSYTPKDKAWGAVRYPLEKAEEGWVGLSEITAHGDFVYIIERDNQIGQAAKIKRLYRVAASEMVPGKIGEALPMVKKELVRDLLPDLLMTGGYALEKVEGFAVDAAGEGFVVTDNDGVNDSNGETLFWSVGKL